MFVLEGPISQCRSLTGLLFFYFLSSFSLRPFLLACTLACTFADFVFFTLEKCVQHKRCIKLYFYITIQQTNFNIERNLMNFDTEIVYTLKSIKKI